MALTAQGRAQRRALLRQLEAALRKPARTEDLRWELRQLHMTPEEIREFETAVRQQIRKERSSSTWGRSIRPSPVTALRT